MKAHFEELPKLTVLSLEDSVIDFEIMREKLVGAGLKLDVSHVDNRKEYLSRIQNNVYDIILADFNLPGIDAFEALELCMANCPDVPFICVSGSIGEITAIELLKHGAVDYVLKDRLERLPFAIHRALEEAKGKKERQLADKALKESEERLRDIIFSTADWVWEVDHNGKYIYSSQRGPELLGASHDEIIGKTPFDFMPEEEAAKIAKIFTQIINEKAPIKDLENWNITGDGRKICLLTNGVPIFDNEGQLTGYRGVDKDITERKNIELELINAKEKAEASDRLKTAFMNNISHEIRTPLNGIIGFGQILTEDDLQPEERSRFIKMLHKSSDRLINTVTNFMDIALLNSGNQGVIKKESDLHTLLNKVITKFGEASSDKKLNLSLQSTQTENKIKIFTDEDLFDKIVYQLIDNAIKFTHEGSVSIGYQLKDSEVIISIKDSGVGISEEKKNQIFGNFIQENISTTRGYEGSGIGLSIAKGFTELLNGKIWLDSDKGKGSTFYLSFPYHDGVNGLMNEKNAIAHPAIQDNHHTILVAEDDDANFIYLETLLKQKAYKILHATNGVEAVEMCKRHPEICLVLMDLKLPEMDGLEATRLIKQQRGELPVIAVTAYAGNEDRQLALQAGCNDYLTKPVKKEFLILKMEEICLSKSLNE